MRIVLDEVSGSTTFEFDRRLSGWRASEQKAFGLEAVGIVAEVLRRRDRFTDHACARIAEKLVGRANARSFSSDLEVARRRPVFEQGSCLGCGISRFAATAGRAPRECPRPSGRSKRGVHVFEEVRHVSVERLAFRAASPA